MMRLMHGCLPALILAVAVPALGGTAQLRVQVGHTARTPLGSRLSAAMNWTDQFVLTTGLERSTIRWDISTGRVVSDFGEEAVFWVATDLSSHSPVRAGGS